MPLVWFRYPLKEPSSCLWATSDDESCYIYIQSRVTVDPIVWASSAGRPVLAKHMKKEVNFESCTIMGDATKGQTSTMIEALSISINGGNSEEWCGVRLLAACPNSATTENPCSPSCFFYCIDTILRRATPVNENRVQVVRLTWRKVKSGSFSRKCPKKCRSSLNSRCSFWHCQWIGPIVWSHCFQCGDTKYRWKVHYPKTAGSHSFPHCFNFHNF
jgi:hypothetical protein